MAPRFTIAIDSVLQEEGQQEQRPQQEQPQGQHQEQLQQEQEQEQQSMGDAALGDFIADEGQNGFYPEFLFQYNPVD